MRRRLLWGWLALCAWSPLPVVAGSVADADPPAITVTLLGTGDPMPRLDRFGPATLVRAGSSALLFDAGRGTMQRLHQLGVSTAELDAIDAATMGTG